MRETNFEGAVAGCEERERERERERESGLVWVGVCGGIFGGE
jgi:hypothetical protein